MTKLCFKCNIIIYVDLTFVSTSENREKTKLILYTFSDTFIYLFLVFNQEQMLFDLFIVKMYLQNHRKDMEHVNLMVA